MFLELQSFRKISVNFALFNVKQQFLLIITWQSYIALFILDAFIFEPKDDALLKVKLFNDAVLYDWTPSDSCECFFVARLSEVNAFAKLRTKEVAVAYASDALIVEVRRRGKNMKEKERKKGR